MMTVKKLYTKYMKMYNSRLFNHSDVERHCNIDKNTLQRLRSNKFENIKMNDAISIIQFLDKKEPKKG